MKIIGITGGIASGKSTVSLYLQDKYKAYIFDADKEAKALLQSSFVKDKILQAKEKFIELKSEHEKVINQRNQKISHAESRVKEKESKLSQKLGQVNNKEKQLDEARKNVDIQLSILKDKEGKSEKLLQKQVELWKLFPVFLLRRLRKNLYKPYKMKQRQILWLTFKKLLRRPS